VILLQMTCIRLFYFKLSVWYCLFVLFMCHLLKKQEVHFTWVCNKILFRLHNFAVYSFQCVVDLKLSIFLTLVILFAAVSVKNHFGFVCKCFLESVRNKHWFLSLVKKRIVLFPGGAQTLQWLHFDKTWEWVLCEEGDKEHITLLRSVALVPIQAYLTVKSSVKCISRQVFCVKLEEYHCSL